MQCCSPWGLSALVALCIPCDQSPRCHDVPQWEASAPVVSISGTALAVFKPWCLPPPPSVRPCSYSLPVSTVFQVVLLSCWELEVCVVQSRAGTLCKYPCQPGILSVWISSYADLPQPQNLQKALLGRRVIGVILAVLLFPSPWRCRCEVVLSIS